MSPASSNAAARDVNATTHPHRMAAAARIPQGSLTVVHNCAQMAASLSDVRQEGGVVPDRKRDPAEPYVSRMQ